MHSLDPHLSVLGHLPSDLQAWGPATPPWPWAAVRVRGCHWHAQPVDASPGQVCGCLKAFQNRGVDELTASAIAAWRGEALRRGPVQQVGRRLAWAPSRIAFRHSGLKCSSEAGQSDGSSPRQGVLKGLKMP